MVVSCSSPLSLFFIMCSPCNAAGSEMRRIETNVVVRRREYNRLEIFYWLVYNVTFCFNTSMNDFLIYMVKYTQ